MGFLSYRGDIAFKEDRRRQGEGSVLSEDERAELARLRNCRLVAVASKCRRSPQK